MKTKSDYVLALRIVGDVICEWDPYSLLASGCPEDEFDPEIACLVALIPCIKSEEDTTAAISRTFSSAFEAEHFGPQACEAVGGRLFAALSAHGLIG